MQRTGIRDQGSEAARPAWVDGYVGIPFREHGRGRDGADCWGLVCLVYGDRAGIVLPPFDGEYEDIQDIAFLERLIRGHETSLPFRPVPLEAAQAMDLALVAEAGFACHIGVVVAPGWMLHCIRTANSRCDRYLDMPMRNRVERGGIHRYMPLEEVGEPDAT